jgi:anti-anti-sigma regulatory factor
MLLKAGLGRAQRLQQSLLPRALPALRGMDFFGFYQPCEQLGGDFFDLIPLRDNRVALFLADVAGHGVRSAMVTVILHQLIQSQRLEHAESGLLSEPALALSYLNRALKAQPFDEPIHVTMGYTVVDAASGDVCYASAGHPRPIVIRRESGRIETLSARGLGLGLEDEPGFNESHCTLNQGDFVVLYSDGVTDSRGDSNRELSIEGLMQWAEELRGGAAFEIGTRLESRLKEFQHGQPSDDDISYVIIRRSSPAAALRDTGRESVRIRAPNAWSERPSDGGAQLATGWTTDSCVVRLTGRATWERAPTLLAILTQASKHEESTIFLDLSACASVDSTILGLLYQFCKKVTLCRPTEKVSEQLLELGLMDYVRVTDKPIPEPRMMAAAPAEASPEEQMRLVLSAHEALLSTSETNRERFGATVEMMRSELGANSAGSGSEKNH